ncbi:hypothetical protein LP414_27155 [Polaromonas sp. P1(28)-13]|nr:hypothetical protein LP414_27155 [Polaromonas sp. P1(28)-13]
MSKAKAEVKRNVPTVAEYLTGQIDLCGKAQHELAKECGYANANIITMLKQGRSKLPMGRVGVMAKALGVDPLFLFSLVMNEYEPETWATIQEFVLKQPLVTNNEMEIIELVRTAKVVNPKLRTIEERQRLLTAINALRPDNVSSED